MTINERIMNLTKAEGLISDAIDILREIEETLPDKAGWQELDIPIESAEGYIKYALVRLNTKEGYEGALNRIVAAKEALMRYKREVLRFNSTSIQDE